jgi:hypothetical protein
MAFRDLPAPVQRGIILLGAVLVISLAFLGAMALIGTELLR